MKDKTYRGIRVPWRYLVAGHGESLLRDWAQRLRYFRFCRAVPGGHAADGDHLYLALDDSALPRRLTKDFPKVDSEGRRLIGTVPVFIHFGNRKLLLSLSGAAGDPYAVSEADVDNALKVEEVIEPLAAHVIDPPLDSLYCIAPKFWPEFWESD